MKIISMGGGFSEHDLRAFRFIIYGNCITQMKVLIGAVEKMGLEYENAENRVCEQISWCRGGRGGVGRRRNVEGIEWGLEGKS